MSSGGEGGVVKPMLKTLDFNEISQRKVDRQRSGGASSGGASGVTSPQLCVGSFLVLFQICWSRQWHGPGVSG